MFNKTTQDVDVEIYQEVEIESREIKNPKEMFKNCYPRIVMLITPSTNLFKVCSDSDYIKPHEKVFEKLSEAKKYWLSIEYKKPNLKTKKRT